MPRTRHHPGWMLLAVVAGFFAVGAVGAYRRATRSPEDRRTPT